MRTVLQVPMTSTLRTNALKTAKKSGFSSLQEVVRLFLTKFAANHLTVSIQENTIPLSPQAEKRYIKMDQDFKNNKNVYTAKDVNDLIKQLNAS